MALVLKSTVASTASGLRKLRRDMGLLDGGTSPGPDLGGVKFAFDLAFSYSWPTLAAPSSSQTVLDTAEVGNGSMNIAASQTVTYAGGGFDFTAMTLDPCEVVGPSGCLSSIYSGLQYFLVSGWYKFPISGDWNTNAALMAMFTATSVANGYTAEADLLTIAQNNTPYLTFRRQTNGGSTTDQINLSPALHYGNVAQVAFWRNAAGQGARIKSPGGTTNGTLAVGSANTGNFSAKQPRWGICGSFSDLTLAPHLNASNMRLYRGHVEDLQISGRDPVTVLDANYAAVTARAAFS